VVSIDFESFTREHYPTVVRTLALAIGDPRAAEDAAQEAFTKASLRWRRVQRMERPAGWVYVVALNSARRALKHRPNVATPTAATPDQVDHVDHATNVTNRLTVHDALGGLAPQQRAAIVLRYLSDLSVADTARALGVTESTIKSATRDALVNLRATLHDDISVDVTAEDVTSEGRVHE
jgi:RNA polymerase sigma-70 factor (ECF subfamily)